MTNKSKIIALKGRRQVGTLTSAQRGLLITAVLCLSAVGHYGPLLTFPLVRMLMEIFDGAPAATKFVLLDAG